MSQRWQALGNTVSDLIGPRFEPQTSRSETNALPLDQLVGSNSNQTFLTIRSDCTQSCQLAEAVYFLRK